MNFPILWITIASILGVVFGVAVVVLATRSAANKARAEIDQARAELGSARTDWDQTRAELDQARARLEALESDLGRRHKELQAEAREQAHREIARLREVMDGEATERRALWKETESRLDAREARLDGRARDLEAAAKELAGREADLMARHDEAQALVAEREAQLERVSALSREQAREELLERVAHESRAAMNSVAARIEEDARENAETRARKILALAMQKCAVDQTSESAVSVVPLPSDDLKGRIIGREGRNIRTFEQLSGTDLIIDDTPEAVVISCFDPVRRETARLALAALVNDGRIHPARIEEALERAAQEIAVKMREACDAACAEAGVHLSRALSEVFGRLLYRTSYGQNILRHSVEMAKLAATIAAELGADVAVAKRAAFLHDIGKALDADQEGTHVDLGIELLRRHHESEPVIRAAGEHHLDVAQMSSIESVIVQIADAISSSRPGARRENVEVYMKRLEALERIANSFDGVEKSFAIQAGREVRIVVCPHKVDDLGAQRLARDVAARVQDEMAYPGEIRITVLRETRATHYAR